MPNAPKVESLPDAPVVDMRALHVAGPKDGTWFKIHGGTHTIEYREDSGDRSVYRFSNTVTDEDGDYAVYHHKEMQQTAPWPIDLETLVRELDHRPTWQAQLIDDYDRGQGCQGLTLVVHIVEPDAHHPEKPRGVCHLFPVPAAAYDYRSWQRWLFNQLNSISLHEDMEHFTIDGKKPYAPSHGPGNDPYLVREVGTELDQRTSFRGEVNPA